MKLKPLLLVFALAWTLFLLAELVVLADDARMKRYGRQDAHRFLHDGVEEGELAELLDGRR